MNDTPDHPAGLARRRRDAAPGRRRAGRHLPAGLHAAAVQPQDREWSDGHTQWYTVNAWRGLAENCAASLRRGDPVVVHGRLKRTYVNGNDVEVLSFEIDAIHVGHDLSRGTSAFTRSAREPAEPVGGARSRPATPRRATRAAGLTGSASPIGSPEPRWPRRLGTMAEYVFTLRNVRKAHGDKVVLDNVTLSFLHGAKIGVVGPNGTGKSSLLKIMAGLDHANNGDAILDPGATVGMLQQEPPLTEGKTVLENVEEAVGEIKAQARPLQRDLRGDGRPRRRLRQARWPRWATCRPSSTTPTPGTSTAASTRRWTRCAARRRTRSSTTSPVVSAAGSRCASCCSSSPTCCSSTSPPTTSTPSRCSGSRATWRPTRAPSWPITHDRYFLDNVAEWILELDRGQTHPYEGNYSTYLETKKDRLKIEGQKDAKRAKMLEKELEWVRSNAKARQTKSKFASRPLRGDGGRGRPDAQDRHLRDQHPGRSAPR